MSYPVYLNFDKEEPCEDKTGLPFDLRLLAYCKDCTLDAKMYVNYLVLLQKTVMATKYFGLLAAGFIPVIMPPSFTGKSLYEEFLPKLQAKFKCYPRPSVSFKGHPYKGGYPDIWISKTDAAELLGKPPEAVRIRDILEVLE
jgi:hypothetical protein